MLSGVERQVVEFFRTYDGPITISAPGRGKNLYGTTIKIQDRKTAHDIALALQDHFNRALKTIKQ